MRKYAHRAKKENIMKKLLALLLALLLVATTFVGCGKNNDDTTLDSETESDNVIIDDSNEEDNSTSFPKPEFTTDIVLTESNPDAETNDVAIADIHTAVKELLGENYIPSMPLDNEFLKETYGVQPEWIESFVAEIPMISFHVDTFIAIKAAEGQADNVEKALNDYDAYVKENSLQYPANVPKINAARVYRQGNYVFYILLAAVPDEFMDDENGAYNFAVQSNENVIAKINELLIK